MSTSNSYPHGHQQKRPHKPKDHSKKEERLTKSSAALNKKIRDLTRLLSRPQADIPADLRLQRERALDAYTQELQGLKDAAKAKKMALRYRHIRFFEQRKASRRLKQAEKAAKGLGNDLEEKRHLMKKLHHAKVDLNYTLYFPTAEKYISLYKESDSSPKAVERKEAIWKAIEKKMEDNTLGEMHTLAQNECEPDVGKDSKCANGKLLKDRRKGNHCEKGNGFFQL